jgi:predicted Zn-dependent protease
MTRNHAIVAILCLLVLTFTANTASASRQRITLAPEPGVYSEADVEKEVIFGREVAANVLAGRKLVADDELNRYINLVGQSIARHSNRPELEYFFAAVESSEINAYAVPGGYIFITTAALELIQNEAELAAVLAHEIAHVADRHIVKALDIRGDDESMTAMVSKIMGSAAESANVIFYQAVDHALELLFSKGLSQEDEYDADLQAVFLSAFAGYDPSAYPRLLARLEGTMQEKRNELGNTHPSLDERIKRIEDTVRNQGLATAENSTNEQRYRRYQPEGG